jgi:hypothetical protein
METSLDDLLNERARILESICELGDFRRGSITGTSGKCGTPTCHCHQPNDAGHGPSHRLTRKVEGKTVTETFRSPALLEKAQREVAAFHRFRGLCDQLTEVNERICQMRPVASARVSPELKKNPWKRSSRKSAKR